MELWACVCYDLSTNPLHFSVSWANAWFRYPFLNVVRCLFFVFSLLQFSGGESLQGQWIVLIGQTILALIVVFSLTLERFEWNEYDVSICWLQILVTHWLSMTKICSQQIETSYSFHSNRFKVSENTTINLILGAMNNIFHIILAFSFSPLSRGPHNNIGLFSLWWFAIYVSLMWP